MNWELVRKDWRINRAVVLGAVVVTVLPYVLTTGNLLFNPPEFRPVTRADWLEETSHAAMAALIFLAIVSAAFGGGAFATERRDRTAEFLGMLPVSRWASVRSKLLVPILCVGGLVAINLLVVYACNEWFIPQARRNKESISTLTFLVVGNSVAMFGSAWALSTFLRSPAIAATVAIGLGIGLLFGGAEWGMEMAQAWDWSFSGNTREEFVLAIVSSCLAAFGIVCVLASSIMYVRRAEV